MDKLEIAVTGALTGLIWLIQLVHYPLFQRTSEKDFSEAMEFHQSRITLIVLPLMLAEVILAFMRGALLPGIPVLLIWMSTFFIQVPQHQRLLGGKENQTLRKLVLYNWPRTILWTLRLTLLIVS